MAGRADESRERRGAGPGKGPGTGSGTGSGTASDAAPGARPGAAPTRLNVAEFLARQRGGALPGGPRAELMGGTLLVAPLPRPPEVAAVVALASRLEPLIGGRALLEFRPALHLGEADLLRPDVALLDAAPRFGRARARPGSEALLAVEVVRGATTMQSRLPRYAAGGVGEAWLLDLAHGWVEVYRSPAAGRYRSRTLWYPGELVGVVALDGVRVEVLGAL